MIRRLCVCGHRRVWHEHYRTGSDCAATSPTLLAGDLPCGCDRWRWRWAHPLAWWRARREAR